MTMMQTRRRFLTTLSLVGAVGLLRVPRTLAAEGQLETTSVRIAKNFGICIAPEYLTEELLRAEGFTQVQYVDGAPHLPLQAIGRGGADFLVSTVMSFITAIDTGDPITTLSGVMVGCCELFGNEALRGISDLKGKSVGVPFLGSGPHQYVTLMAADVGLDPVNDIHWVTADRPHRPRSSRTERSMPSWVFRPSRRISAPAISDM